MIKQVELTMESFGLSEFLFYKVSDHAGVNSNEVDLLSNGRVSGLLPIVAIEKGDDIYFRYDIVSSIRLENYFTSVITKEELHSSLLDVLETLLDAQEHGLNSDNFVLNKSYIFIDKFSNRLLFIYMPIKNNSFEKVSLKEFLREFMYIAPYEEKDDQGLFIKLHNCLVGNEEVNLVDLKNLLEDYSEKSSEPQQDQGSSYYSPGTTSPESEAGSTEENGVLTSHYSNKKVDKKRKLEIEEEVNYKRITRTELDDQNSGTLNKAALGSSKINIAPNDGNDVSIEWDTEYEGTTVLGASNAFAEDEGTTILGIDNRSETKPFLLSLSNDEKIFIEKETFKIGRDPYQTDYTLKNKVVGRVHAHFITVNDEYFIEDNHSTNGSFVNGVKLKPKEKMKVKHEDKIKLANEEFIFRLF